MRAWATPALTRSRMMSRSNSAKYCEACRPRLCPLGVVRSIRLAERDPAYLEGGQFLERRDQVDKERVPSGPTAKDQDQVEFGLLRRPQQVLPLGAFADTRSHICPPSSRCLNHGARQVRDGGAARGASAGRGVETRSVGPHAEASACSLTPWLDRLLELPVLSRVWACDRDDGGKLEFLAILYNRRYRRYTRCRDKKSSRPLTCSTHGYRLRQVVLPSATRLCGGSGSDRPMSRRPEPHGIRNSTLPSWRRTRPGAWTPAESIPPCWAMSPVNSASHRTTTSRGTPRGIKPEGSTWPG